MSGFKAKLRRAVNEEGFKWTETLEAISEEIELLACDIRALRSSDSSPAAPPPDGNRPEKLDSSPAVPQPAATDAKRTFMSSWILRRNRVKGSDWNGSCCPACDGSRRIWFQNFHDWTCICASPEKKAWWDDTNAVDEDWLNELVWRWSVDAKKYPGIPSSSPAAPQPAAPTAGWLTERERRAVAYFAQVCRDDLVPDEWTDNAGVMLSILARAGSPPVERPILRIAHLPSINLLGTGIEYDLGRCRARDLIVQSLLDAGYRVEIPGYGIREPEASAPFPVVRYFEKSPE